MSSLSGAVSKADMTCSHPSSVLAMPVIMARPQTTFATVPAARRISRSDLRRRLRATRSYAAATITFVLSIYLSPPDYDSLAQHSTAAPKRLIRLYCSLALPPPCICTDSSRIAGVWVDWECFTCLSLAIAFPPSPRPCSLAGTLSHVGTLPKPLDAPTASSLKCSC